MVYEVLEIGPQELVLSSVFWHGPADRALNVHLWTSAGADNRRMITLSAPGKCGKPTQLTLAQFYY